jgi:hypothetical protein
VRPEALSDEFYDDYAFDTDSQGAIKMENRGRAKEVN